MGINFLRAKKEQYEQKRDASRLTLDVCDMFDRGNPDRVTEQFSVTLRDRATRIEKGLSLLLKFVSDNAAVAVQNAVVIGDLAPSDALKLLQRIHQVGKTSGMLKVLIANEPDFTGTFQVKLANPKELR
jgi:hypothetical protein